MNLSTATATKKGKQSPGDYVRILYSKSRVTLHPTPYARDNKPGFLALVLRNELEPGDRGNGSSTSVAQSPPPPTTTTAAASTGSDLAKRNATHVFLVWLSEDVAKQRQETSKFIEMELRGAEGLNNLAGPHLGRRRVAEGVADASTESGKSERSARLINLFLTCLLTCLCPLTETSQTTSTSVYLLQRFETPARRGTLA